MTTYFPVTLPQPVVSPLSGNTTGVTGSTFIPGVDQWAQVELSAGFNSNAVAPSFSPTLDGSVYTITVTWNLFGQRHFVNCYDGSSNLVFTVALVETPPSLALEGLTWSAAALQVTATTLATHGFPIGSVIELTLVGANPATYNGSYDVFITGPSTFQFAMTTDPGSVVSCGSASFVISMCRGYFNSTLIYRNGQFEVSP